VGAGKADREEESRQVAEQPGLGFAGLLRQLRAQAKLTQEELAEAAGLSPRSVSDLERGIHGTARKDTALLLGNALGLAEPELALFVSAARGRAAAAEVLAASRESAPRAATAVATRTLPRDTVSFTGRDDELARLLDVLTPAATGLVLGIHAIDGMAGIGKTTLAVHAAHQLADKFPDGQFYLPLHAHTPGQRPVDPADALTSLLLTAGLSAQQIPPELEARAAVWRDHVAGKKILLLLDDAAGHEQVRPLLPGAAGSLVLITSRRRLAALDGTAQMSLSTLSPGDAAVLLVRLAGRASLNPGDAAVDEITRLCGFLPLAIGMIASQLRNHPARTAAALAAELAAARDRPALMRAENVSVRAAFDLSYADLSPGQQRVFRRLGLVPGPTVDAFAAAALDGTALEVARRHLDDLYDHHLIAEPAPGRYELHDLLREHARQLVAADDSADREASVARLLDYYLDAALAAGRHFIGRPGRYGGARTGRPPTEAPDLSALDQAAAWLEAERANLHAAADYAARHGISPHRAAIPAAMSEFLFARGYWDESATLHHAALSSARQAGDLLGQAGALDQLGNVQRETGDYQAAVASLTHAAAIYRQLRHHVELAYTLGSLGFVQVLTGAYAAAAAGFEQALALAHEASDQGAEACALTTRGLLQTLTGDYRSAYVSLLRAQAIYLDVADVGGQAITFNSLGVVQQETGDYAAAIDSQQQALALFRGLGHRMGQAYALNDVGLAHQEIREYETARSCHRDALALFRDLGNRLGQAEALNRLGELATRMSAPADARSLHTQALAIARDLRAVPEEARALEGIGRSHVQGGNVGEGAASLQLALEIYEHLGMPRAQSVRQTMTQV
jgi:tetratricopeptide (TPR) repeat protein/transcriptional regulator with XRE-family HTH domain